LDELVQYMKALLLLQIADRQGGPQDRVEVLLARAGLRVRDIAALLDKSEAAVAKTISRAKAAPKRKESDSDE
jgi:DNA-directed RNA polymerase specialized sigma24 family protein